MSEPSDPQIPPVIITGAREHNLRIDRLEIPRRKLVVVSGPSGSGKSSLVFDTLYREAYRRFIGVAGARGVLSFGRLPAPAVDRIENLSLPAALRPRVSRARLTAFASIAGIFPLLRVFFDRLGERHCVHCGAALNSARLVDAIECLRRVPPGSEVCIFGTLSSSPGLREEETERLASRGYTRLAAGGTLQAIEDLQALEEAGVADIQLIVDIFKSGPRAEPRLVDAVQGVFRELAQATVKIAGQQFLLAKEPICSSCGQPNVAVDSLSFNYFSREAACRTCGGFGSCLSVEEQAFDAQNLRELLADEFAKASLDGLSAEGVRRLLADSWRDSANPRLRTRLEERGTLVPCPECDGARVSAPARVCALAGVSFAELFRSSVTQCLLWAKALRGEIDRLSGRQPRLQELLSDAHLELTARLEWFVQVGLGYLELNRAASTLSAGELYRADLGRTVSRPLMGLLYLLDEPASGLHLEDLSRIIAVLQQLIQIGNSVIVVDHHPLLLAEAEHLIELGPHGGKRGGLVTAVRAGKGEPYAAPEITGRPRASDANRIMIRGARKHNLKNVNVDFFGPGVVAVRGVSGSGKSALIFETLGLAVRHLLRGSIEQSSVFKLAAVDSIEGWQRFGRVVDSRTYLVGSRSKRSIVATAAGVMTPLRELFAQTRSARVLGLHPRNFSFNSADGWCAKCRGIGLDERGSSSLLVPCESCGGGRFNAQVQLVRYRGFSLPELLNLTIDEAAGQLAVIPAVNFVLRQYQAFGLGYLTLAQSSRTLSLGEAQRVRLISDMGMPDDTAGPQATRRTLYLFDEPCRGLHVSEVPLFLNLLRQLAVAGHTIIAVEHHPEFLAQADYVVELGPGAGPTGGKVVSVLPHGSECN